MTYKLSIQVRTVDDSPMHKHLLQYICAGLDIECKFTNETYRKPMIITRGTEERIRKCAKILRRLQRGKPRFKVVALEMEKGKLCQSGAVIKWTSVCESYV